MTMLEIEKTYLAKYLPETLPECESKEIIDVYIPKESAHPTLRLRKNGNRYELTKKEVITQGDHSQFIEQTIPLRESEFTSLYATVVGKPVRKIRYIYPLKNGVAEIDVFQDALAGLVTVDVEFKSVEDKDTFQMPEFCLVDVTQADFIAGGMLCGKSYADIQDELDKLAYVRLVY